MTDQSPDEAPPVRRRRWLRWIILTLLTVVVWLCVAEGPTVRRARNLRLGQTVAEVRQIMGPPWGLGSTRLMTESDQDITMLSRTWIYTTKAELWRSSAHYLLSYALGSVSLAGLIGKPGFVVEVQFDESGRVQRIQRGREVVE